VEKSLQNKSYNLSLRAAFCSPLFAQFVGAMGIARLKGVGSLGNRFTFEQVQSQSEKHSHRCIMKDPWMECGRETIFHCIPVS
jgi:hypothetical protein